MALKFTPIPTDLVRNLQAGGLDANGQKAEIQVSDGAGNPCRHCLREIPAGEDMLVLAYRPFPNLQPYAELGPVFLCSRECERHPESDKLPVMFQSWDKILIRAYESNDRIIYGTGNVIDTTDVVKAINDLFKVQETAYVHMRSASNNCYQCRVEVAREQS